MGSIETSKIIKYLKQGKIIIYPGDEAYEIFCCASHKESLEKLLNAGIEGIPSLVVNSKEWITKNLNANSKYIDKLPGPFTFMLKPKKGSKIYKEIIQNGLVSVRLIDNELSALLAKEKLILFSYIIRKKGRLIIDKSAIPGSVKKLADFVIDKGKLEIKPHVVIDLTGDVARLVK